MLSRLRLTDFRNHAGLVLAPGPGFVVLTGENGAGKTNVLEAVSLLAPGRGLRRAALSEIARDGGPGGFGIAATLGDATEIATGALPTAPERRVVRINGAGASSNALAERLSVLWLTPAMDRLFVEPASERRRFLDRLTLLRFAVSLGGSETLITHPATTTHYALTPAERAAGGITDATLRLSVGIEHVEDLLADLAQALDAV